MGLDFGIEVFDSVGKKVRRVEENSCDDDYCYARKFWGLVYLILSDWSEDDSETELVSVDDILRVRQLLKGWNDGDFENIISLYDKREITEEEALLLHSFEDWYDKIFEKGHGPWVSYSFDAMTLNYFMDDSFKLLEILKQHPDYYAKAYVSY